MEKEDMKNSSSKRRKISIAVVLLSALGIIYASYSLIAYARESALRKQTYDEVRQQAVQETENKAATDQTDQDANSSPVPKPEFEGWLAEYAQIPDRDIDFDALKQKNPDVYAWIYVPGTGVDFPILYAEKNDYYYLHHDINRRESEAGAIYTDAWNSKDFSDRMTLIYGHNMKDGTMFAPLHKYKDTMFFKDNDVFYVYMQDVMLKYKIFAAYQAADNHILANNDFTIDEVFAEYLESIYDTRDISANFRDGVEPGIEDRIVTLVSSVLEDDNSRYFVQGILQKNE